MKYMERKVTLPRLTFETCQLQVEGPSKSVAAWQYIYKICRVHINVVHLERKKYLAHSDAQRIPHYDAPN